MGTCVNVKAEDLLAGLPLADTQSSKNKKIVGMSDMQTSKNPGDLLITYSLGSCVGITIFDAEVRVGGMIHCMLPLSKTDKAKAMAKPAMFVDTGIPLLFKSLFKLGATKSRMIIRVAGCAQMLNDDTLFRIGKRNYTVMKKLLWKNDLLIQSEHVGGSLSRTLSLDMENGRSYLKIMGEQIEL